MAIFLRGNHKGKITWAEFGGNNVFLSLRELNISSLFSAEWLPQKMGFFSPLQCHGYSTVAPLEEKYCPTLNIQGALDIIMLVI